MSKPKAPAFQFYASDFLGSRRVRMMTLEDRGAYITLLADAWDEDGLPTDLDDVAQLLGLKATSKQFKRIWKRVGLAFELIDGRLRNPRQERERVKVKEFSAMQSERAKSGWQKDAEGMPRHSRRNAGKVPAQCSPSPSPSPNPLNPPVPDGNGGGIRGGEPKATAEVMATVLAELKPRLVG